MAACVATLVIAAALYPAWHGTGIHQQHKISKFTCSRCASVAALKTATMLDWRTRRGENSVRLNEWSGVLQLRRTACFNWRAWMSTAQPTDSSVRVSTASEPPRIRSAACSAITAVAARRQSVYESDLAPGVLAGPSPASVILQGFTQDRWGSPPPYPLTP